MVEKLARIGRKFEHNLIQANRAKWVAKRYPTCTKLTLVGLGWEYRLARALDPSNSAFLWLFLEAHTEKILRCPRSFCGFSIIFAQDLIVKSFVAGKFNLYFFVFNQMSPMAGITLIPMDSQFDRLLQFACANNVGIKRPFWMVEWKGFIIFVTLPLPPRRHSLGAENKLTTPKASKAFRVDHERQSMIQKPAKMTLKCQAAVKP